MATIALQGAGFAAAGPAGGLVFTAAASYLDSQFVLPALFPQDPVKGQTLQELQVHGSDEGHPINRCYSRESRVAGAIIWMPRTFNSRTETEDTGKGGGGEKVERTFHNVDVAVLACEGPPDGLGIESIDRIYADTTLIYDDTPNVNVSSDELSCTVEDGYAPVFNGSTMQFTQELFSRTLIIESPDGGQDLSELRSGVDAVIAGWTETDYNGTKRCLQSSKRNDGTTSASFQLLITDSTAGEAAGNTITIDQTNTQIDKSRVKDITIHLGTETQLKDSFMAGVEGIENISAHRGLAYVVIEGLELEDFGNRVPNFTLKPIVGSTDDLEDVVDDIMGDTDFDASEWDATALSGVTCNGYTTRGPVPTISAFQPLSMCFDLLAQDLNGVLTFFQRINAEVVNVLEADLFAHLEDARNGPWPHKLDHQAGREAPAEILIKYQDRENQLQPGEQRERRPTAKNLFEKKTVDVTVVFDGGEARDVAAKLLWTSKTAQIEYEIVVPPSYPEILENDVISYTYDGETYRFLVQDVTDGVDGTRVCTGFAEVAAHMTHNSPHELPRNPDTFLTSPYDIRLEPIDVGPLQAGTSTTPVVYFAAASRQGDVGWAGASLFQSQDGGLTWNLREVFTTQATIGTTETELTSLIDSAHWDRATILTVVLKNGSLSSVTELECLNGLNRAVVGSEVIGFQNATLAVSQPMDGKRYELTKLLRGLAGTELQRDAHTLGDRFVFLNAASTIPLEFSTSAIDSTRDYVAVSPGGDPDDFEKHSIPVLCNNVRPLHPVHLFAERNAPASNDWTITWTRRSRQYFRIFSQTAPLLEPGEDYVVDVRDAGDVTTVRVITSTATANGSQVTIVNGAPQVVYDEQDQIDDFGSAQATIRVRVYQVSDLAGRGRGTGTLIFS